jgi:hypothetical protein
VTDPTATFEIDTLAVPFLPSLVAVIVVLPAAAAVTKPVVDTVAAEEFELPHVTTRPASALPAASLSVAVNCVVCPTDIVIGLGVTVTVATAACETEMVAVPFFPSDVAVIVAVPVLTVVIMPLASTVATAALLVLHVMARPLSGFSPASYAVAESCACTPGAASTCGGVTTTLATGVFSTVIVAIPDLPFTLAATCVDPSATPVTTPVLEIVAMLGFWTDQKTSVAGIVFPPPSWTSAWSGICEPTETVVAGGVIDTDATSIVVTTSLATTHAAMAAVVIQTATRRARGVSKRNSSRFPTLLKRRGRASIN